MKVLLKIIIATIIILGFATCQSYDFDQEQYKNEINLLSNSDLIYDRQVASLKKEGDTIYLVAGLSGSRPSARSFHVALVESDSLFNVFNKSNFDINEDRFAKFLPKECYTFPTKEMDIPAGSFQVKFPIYLKNLERLSPDSIYLLNYKIDETKTKDFNHKKKDVLIRIFKENEFASTKKSTFYNYTSSYVTTLDKASPFTRRPTNANQVFPIGENSVRMLAGDETFGDYKTALDRIKERSITVTVGKQTPQNPLAREVKIEAYNSIDVIQMPPTDIYDNTFLINTISTPDGRKTYYKEFRLHYKYRLQGNVPYKEVKAILRMQYNPRADLL